MYRIKGSYVVGILMFLILAGCQNQVEHTAPAIRPQDSVAMMTSYGVNTLVSDSGVMKYRIVTERWEVNTSKNPSLWIFDKGLLLEQFDEKFHINSYIQCDTAERREVHTTGAKQNIERQQILQTGEINNDTIRTDVIERIRREREERQRDLQSAIRSLKEQQHSYSNITETISRYAEKFRNFAGEKLLNLIKKTQEVLSPKKEEIKTYKPTKRREQGQGRGY